MSFLIQKGALWGPSIRSTFLFHKGGGSSAPRACAHPRVLGRRMGGVGGKWEKGKKQREKTCRERG